VKDKLPLSISLKKTFYITSKKSLSMKNYIIVTLLLTCFTLMGQTAFRHTTAANNLQGHITILDHPQLNGNPNAIIFIMPNWNTGGSGGAGVDYLESPGVWYNGKNWTIFNQNTSRLLSYNTTFNVLIAPPNNPSYFTVSKTAENSVNVANGFTINHPATNNKSNAFLLVTQNLEGVYNDDNPITSYANGKWNIGNTRYMQYYNDNSRTQFVMKMGARFNVMVIENGTVPGFTNATAFLHTATTSNTIPAGQNITFLENPSVNTDTNAIIFATPYWGHGDADRKNADQAGGPYNGSNICVWYDHPKDSWNHKNNYWSIYNSIGGIMMPVGAKFHLVAVGAKSSEPIKPITGVEIYAPEATKRDTAKLYIRFPNQKTAQLATVEIINGLIIYQGDIILGQASKYFKLDDNGNLIPSIEPSNDAGTPLDIRLWPNGIIPFIIQAGHPRASDIQEAIRRINSSTNICVRPRSGENDFIEFTYVPNEASSRIGRQGGNQEVRIGTASLFGIASIQHEILHASGMFHEQSRADRDQFVQINWSNISSDRQHNFNREDRTLTGCAYDYGSIMHYNRTAFAINPSQPTIIPTRPLPAGVTMGQRNGLSVCDIQGLRFLYPNATGCNPTPQPASNDIVTFFPSPNYAGQGVGFNESTNNATLSIMARSLRVRSGYIVEITFDCGGEFPNIVNYVGDNNVTINNLCKVKIMPIIETRVLTFPNITDRCPQRHIRAGQDFNGDGPLMKCSAGLSLSALNQLQLNVAFSAEGRAANSPKVEDNWVTNVLTAPAGMRIVFPGYIPPLGSTPIAGVLSRAAGAEFGFCNEGQVHISTRDFQLEGTLIRELIIVGDTGSKDIKDNCGCDTKIKLMRFNPATAYIVRDN
jgi:Astacin (Peptidase family M12A)